MSTPDAQAPFASEPELPAGWEAAESRSSGDTYFVNSLTGESTYDRPTAPAAEAAGAAQSEAAGPEGAGPYCDFSFSSPAGSLQASPGASLSFSANIHLNVLKNSYDRMCL